MAGLDAAVWWRIGWLSFGGPAGQIALMQRLLVEELRWIDNARFLAALNFCMLLPGPEAQQLATYIGWHRGGWRGALVAGGLFVLPGMLTMLALSAAYVSFGRLPAIEALLLGVKCAVVVIVVEALLRIARRALVFRGAGWVALTAFIALHGLAAPFPAIVAIAAAIGWLIGRRGAAAAELPSNPPSISPPVGSPRTPWKLVGITAFAWIGPLVALLLWRGADDLLTKISVMYSELAIVTFGGAYAVLSHVAELAVVDYGWLSAQQMADGLGLAETTPGPLILVLQFVAFVAAYQLHPGDTPVLAGACASVLAVWFLFVPSFLWIFLAGPHLERITANRALRTALSFVTAAVVGVIANLSLWFAVHVLFARVARAQMGVLQWWEPQWSTLDLRALGLTAIAALLLFGLRQHLLRTLAITALAGLITRAV